VKFVNDLHKAGVEKDVIRLLMKCVDPDRDDRLATAGVLADRAGQDWHAITDD